MKRFEYAAPATIQDSLRAFTSAPADGVRVLAGGTDVLALMKLHIAEPEVLLNVKRVSDLPRGIAFDHEGLILGALATLADIELDRGIARSHPLLAQAAASAATPQLRNMATLGGTLLQRPRCWYFRNEHFKCWLKGGDECTARQGENQFHALFDTGPCLAVHPSDVACALAVLDAKVCVQGPKGARTVPLSDFLLPPSAERRVETTLNNDELVLSVRVPKLADGTESIYLKAMDRAVWAFATVSVAALMRIEDGVIEDVRMALGGVAAIPWPVTDAMQALIGKRADEAPFAAAARAALDKAEPLRMNAYKIPLTEALIKRALTTLSAGASPT